jgi:serine/threonine-protein kinase
MSPSTNRTPSVPIPEGYKLLGPTGSGATGAVYKIEHLISKRIEAMKLLPCGPAADPAVLQRFEREIQVQARLHHPNIVELYTAVRSGSCIALIMEYVEGESLQRILESGPLPVKTALNFTGQILSALSCAHAAGVIHRDVSPANIVVTHDRTAKLTDFGLARTPTDPRLTNSGIPVGSPWYMSPEQVRGMEPLDARSDIYGAAAVLYEMLTGKKVFSADTTFAAMQAQVETQPAPPSTHNRAIPRALDAAILRALAKDPAQRFQSAEEFRAALVNLRVMPALPFDKRRIAAMAFAPVAFVAGFAAVAITHAPKPKLQRAPAVASAPAPAPEPAPQIAAEPAPAADPVTAPATQAAHRLAKPTPAPVNPVRVSGGEVQTADAAPPAPAGAIALPEPPAPEPAPVVVPPPDAPLPAEGGATPNKPRNPVVRVLGKINPFKKKK